MAGLDSLRLRGVNLRRTAPETLATPQQAERARAVCEPDEKIIVGLSAAAMEAYERAVGSNDEKTHGTTDDGYDFYARFSYQRSIGQYVTLVTVQHPVTGQQHHQAFNNFGDPVKYDA